MLPTRPDRPRTVLPAAPEKSLSTAAARPLCFCVSPSWSAWRVDPRERRGHHADLRHEPREQLGVDIAAGQHHDGSLVCNVEFAGEKRSEPDRASALPNAL